MVVSCIYSLLVFHYYWTKFIRVVIYSLYISLKVVLLSGNAMVLRNNSSQYRTHIMLHIQQTCHVLDVTVLKGLPPNNNWIDYITI